jgi:hypothetical protein
MKHHAYATEVATRWKRPARLSPKARKRCKFPPPDGREVAPPAVWDFRAIIEAAPVYRVIKPGVNVAPAFEAAGL